MEIALNRIVKSRRLAMATGALALAATAVVIPLCRYGGAQAAQEKEGARAAGQDDEKSICDAIVKNVAASGLRYGWPLRVRGVRSLLQQGGGMCGDLTGGTVWTISISDLSAFASAGSASTASFLMFATNFAKLAPPL